MGVVLNGDRGGVLFTVRDGLSWYLSALDDFLPFTQNVFINPLPYMAQSNGVDGAMHMRESTTEEGWFNLLGSSSKD